MPDGEVSRYRRRSAVVGLTLQAGSLVLALALVSVIFTPDAWDVPWPAVVIAALGLPWALMSSMRVRVEKTGDEVRVVNRFSTSVFPNSPRLRVEAGNARVVVSYLGAVPRVVYLADPESGQSEPVMAAGFVAEVPSDLINFLYNGQRAR
jgi:hypothetical protein